MSFLGMRSSSKSDPKGDFLNQWIRHSGDSFKSYRDSLKSLVDAENQSRSRHEDFAKALRKSADDLFAKNSQSTSHRLSEVANVLNAIEEQGRSASVNVINADVITACSNMLNQVKHQKDQVKKRNKQFEQADSLYKKYRKQNEKSNRDQRQITSAQNAYESERGRLQVTENQINQTMIEFESEKAAVTQHMMLQFIRARMEYHARALEGLTAAYSHVLSMTLDSDLEKLSAKLTKYTDDGAHYDNNNLNTRANNATTAPPTYQSHQSPTRGASAGRQSSFSQQRGAYTSGNTGTTQYDLSISRQPTYDTHQFVKNRQSPRSSPRNRVQY